MYSLTFILLTLILLVVVWSFVGVYLANKSKIKMPSKDFGLWFRVVGNILCSIFILISTYVEDKLGINGAYVVCLKVCLIAFVIAFIWKLSTKYK